jgi:hypothetical protein
MKMISSIVFLSLVITCSLLFQGCETTGAAKSQISQNSLWNNRVGNYTLGQAMTEYGQPRSRKELGNGLTELYWEQNELYNSSKSAPQTVTVDKFGQPKSDTQSGVIGFQTRKLTLLFDKEGKLRSWQQK